MTVRFTPQALLELDEILTWISERSPSGGKAVQRRIKAMIELLDLQPHLGRQTTDKRLRRLVVTPYPYLVFYETDGSHVTIIAVRHGAERPDSFPGSE